MQISILCAVRDEERYIREMFSSLVGQGFRDWELLVVDDGSVDATADIVEEYAAQDRRVRLLRRGVQLGKVSAYNLAYAASVGDIVIMLAGDDRLPAGSLEIREATMSDIPSTLRGLASFKLRSFSERKAFDGMVLPRGKFTSLSGGVLTMNRALADAVFPIPEGLPSEDIWLREAAMAVAEIHRESSEVVLEYRIHEGNSNPRMQPFESMNTAIAARFEAYRLLAASAALQVSEAQRESWREFYRLEQLRRAGKTWSILLADSQPLIRRLGLLSMSSPVLWRLRTTFYKALSGWQGR